ncbi:MAG: DM13 domain-containing protein [Ahrensia sp.]|nr:DM13 domain-containing protein [Ahrensia sp.]
MLSRLAIVCAFLLSLFTIPVFAADKSGSFRSVGNYSVRGTVKVSSSGKITLSGFRTSSGPDLFVYVGNGRPTRRVAKLRRFSGTQTYSIPASVAKSITSVHIYCKRFSSTFGTARIR